MSDKKYKYTVNINGAALQIISAPSLFSPSSADRGTLALLRGCELPEQGTILDLGCGAGIIGLYAAAVTSPDRVYMTDCDQKAVDIAAVNASLNHLEGVTITCCDGFKAYPHSGFSLILTNPPYHTDYSVAKEFIEKGFNRLVVGGRMAMVVKNELWYKKKLISIFGGVRILHDDGYSILIAEKRLSSYSNKK